MKQGKHIAQTQAYRAPKRKSTLLIALLLIAVFAVSGTLAYLVANTEAVENKFTLGSIIPEIEENVGGGYKKDVTIKNSGNSPAYIRVAVVANKIDEDNVTGPADVSSYLGGENWHFKDGYWYYTKVVDAGDSTTDLVEKDILLEGIQVTILAEAIQAEGTNAEGVPAVVDAWGIDPSTLKPAA